MHLAIYSGAIHIKRPRERPDRYRNDFVVILRREITCMTYRLPTCAGGPGMTEVILARLAEPPNLSD